MDSFFDDIEFNTNTYKNWEDIPVSTLNFQSQTSQLCYIALNKTEATKRMNEISLPKDTIAYEYKENIKLKKNEVILCVEIDTSNMFDTTNLAELKHHNISNSPLIRTVKPISNLGYSNYIVIYIIKDNRAVKNIFKTQQ